MSPTARERCLNDRCWSQTACEGFGYCREWNSRLAAIEQCLMQKNWDDARILFRRAITAAEEAARADAWQPIETAPKGSMFIYYEPRGDKRCIGLAYLAKDGHWRDSEGNWSRQLSPTHWMPLPAPPSARRPRR